MALQMLSLHWKATRWMLLPLVVVAFGIPLVSVQGLGMVTNSPVAEVDAYTAVQVMGGVSFAYPLLATALGLLLALTAWNWDHRGDHVYALSLPIARSRYALLKFVAGAVLALPAVAALLVGSLAATASIAVPVGLDAYPLALATRFLLATLLVYAAFFALAAGTRRTAVIVLGLLLAGPVVAEIGVSLAEVAVPDVDLASPIQWAVHVVWTSPGPLEVFNGSWMLLDV